jgi:hypothetical protein
MTNEEIDKALKRIDVEIVVPRFNWKRDSDCSVSFTDSTEFYFEGDTGLPMVQWFEEILDLDPDEMVDMTSFHYQGKGEIMVEVTVDNDMATLFIKKMDKNNL